MATLEIRKTTKLPKSSIIEKLIYDKEACELTVYFESGNVYYYKDVPQNVVKALSRASSVGSFFSSNIKGRFKFVKLENTGAEL